MGYWTVRALIRLLLWLFYRRVEVTGLERVPASGPVVIAANHHNSRVDAMLVVGTLPRRVAVLANAPLFRNPLIGPFLRLIGAVPVHRRQEAGDDPGKNKAMFQAAAATLRGCWDIFIARSGALTKPINLEQLLGTLARGGVTPAKAPAGTVRRDTTLEAKRSLRKRFLVVDEAHEFRQTLVEYLEGKGFDVMQAGDGLEALQRIPEFRPHVVLLDIAMPRLSGVEVLRKIKVLPQTTCVVMISGIDDLEMAKQTLALGAADYVPKPVDFQYLDTVLETHLFLGQI